jgi:hypothetical protein
MPYKRLLLLTILALLVGFVPSSSNQVKAATPFFMHDDDDDDPRGQDRRFVVDDDSRCPNARFTSIQAAVNAAPAGATILVCPGTYHEQVKITKSLNVIGVSFQNENAAVVQPAPALANSTSTTTNNPIAAIILVDRARNVNLKNLTVDGSTNGINACAPTLVGIYYRKASGTIDSVAVRNVRLGTGLEGCQSGLAIFVQGGGAGGSSNEAKVDVLNSSVHDYQKNGITANETGADVWVKGNAVSGIGPSADIAQNGIQIAFGARGRIEENSVINHIYSLCVSTSICSFNASNILVNDSDNVRVAKNNVGKSQVNILIIGDGADVRENTAFDTDVFDGIALIGNNNRALANSIFNSDEAGVFVQGNGNRVNGNTINEAPIGILEGAPSSGNDFHQNRFFNTARNIVTPTTPNVAQSIIGSRVSGRAPASPTQP